MLRARAPRTTLLEHLADLPAGKNLDMLGSAAAASPGVRVKPHGNMV